MTKGDDGSTGQAVLAGLLIPLLCLPLLIVAVPWGGFVAWRLLAAVTHRPVFAYVTFDQPGGLEVAAHIVGAITVGITAALLVGVPVVRTIAREAKPRTLFRVGATGLAAAAVANWWWSGGGTQAWLGTLVGLRFACTYTAAAQRARRARALPA